MFGELIAVFNLKSNLEQSDGFIWNLLDPLFLSVYQSNRLSIMWLLVKINTILILFILIIILFFIFILFSVPDLDYSNLEYIDATSSITIWSP